MQSVRKDESTIPLCLSGTKNSADLRNLVVRRDIRLLFIKTLKVLLQAINAGCVVFTGDYRDARSDWSRITSYIAIITPREVIIILLKH